MPGQGKRRRRRQDEARRAAARFAPEAGHRVLLLESSDERQVQSFLRQLRESEPEFDGSALRIDRWCRRPTGLSTIGVSRFVPVTDTPDQAGAPGAAGVR